MVKNYRFKIFLFIFSIFFFSCKTLPQTQNDFLQTSLKDFEIIDCTKKSDSVNFFKTEQIQSFSKKTPTFFVIKFNLSNPNLKIKIYPEQKNEWYNSQNVKTFAKKNNLFLAVNTNPFRTKNRYNLTAKTQPVGVVINQKNLINPPQNEYAALLFFKNQNGFTAKIVKNQNNIEENADFTVGGFFQILENENLISFKEIYDTRMATGLSKKTNDFFILSGKNLSFNDCAKILKALGATDAMEFDGGSSTHLVLKNRSIVKEFLTPNVPSVLGFKFNFIDE